MVWASLKKWNVSQRLQKDDVSWKSIMGRRNGLCKGMGARRHSIRGSEEKEVTVTGQTKRRG